MSLFFLNKGFNSLLKTRKTLPLKYTYHIKLYVWKASAAEIEISNMLSNFFVVLLLLVNPSRCIDILSTPLSNVVSEKDLRNIHETSRDVYGQVIEPSLNNTTNGHKDVSLVDGGQVPENQRNLSTNGEFHLIEMCWYNQRRINMRRSMSHQQMNFCIETKEQRQGNALPRHTL